MGAIPQKNLRYSANFGHHSVKQQWRGIDKNHYIKKVYLIIETEPEQRASNVLNSTFELIIPK